jgi:tripartite-type tricarboxylate transporter receptor subunit TctC
MPQVKNGKLRALGLIENRRFAGVPGVPTIGETVHGYAVPDTWFGFLGPAGLPRPVLDRLNSEIRSALNNAEVRQRIENLGMEVTGDLNVDQMAAKVAAEGEMIRKIVNTTGIKPE